MSSTQLPPSHRYRRVLQMSIVVCSLLLLGSTCVPRPPKPTSNTVTIVTFDFVPTFGSNQWDPVCTSSRPRIADTAQYWPNIVLDNAVATETTLLIDIFDQKSNPDKRLGTMTAIFPIGSDKPQTLLYNFQAGAQNNLVGDPSGGITSFFWLACTAACDVKGNAGRGDDTTADVYLKVFGRRPTSVTVTNSPGVSSFVHTVNCR